MVEGVDVIGSSITGEKQITVVLRYHGQKNSPSHYSNALSIPFSFKNDLRLSGTSIVKMNWVSPNMVNVNLSGNTTLYDTNIIGIEFIIDKSNLLKKSFDI